MGVRVDLCRLGEFATVAASFGSGPQGFLTFALALEACGAVSDGTVRVICGAAGGGDIDGRVGTDAIVSVRGLLDQVSFRGGETVDCCGCGGGRGVNSSDANGKGEGVGGAATDGANVGDSVDNVSSGNSVHSDGTTRVRQGVPLGESKLERNRRWRREKKDLKIKRQLMGKDWRAGRGCAKPDHGAGKSCVEQVSEPKGFFSTCDESVRKELRDTRAALLIAKK